LYGRESLLSISACRATPFLVRDILVLFDKFTFYGINACEVLMTADLSVKKSIEKPDLGSG
jgi:hypothetical protein